MSSPARPQTPEQPRRQEHRPTYAQIAASPPRTPTRPNRRLTSPDTHAEQAHTRGRTDSRAGKPPTPPLRDSSSKLAPPASHVLDGSNDDLDWSPGSTARREREKEENEEIMHYGYPTLEDWKNLSVHGNDSMCSEAVKDCLGETLAHYGGDIEQHVTDGIDRHGNPIPGKEYLIEEERKRKRQRTEIGRPAEPKKTSIRFRKYRPLPNPTHPADPKEKVREWMESANTGGARTFTEAAELRAETQTERAEPIQETMRESNKSRQRGAAESAKHYGTTTTTLECTPPPPPPSWEQYGLLRDAANEPQPMDLDPTPRTPRTQDARHHQGDPGTAPTELPQTHPRTHPPTDRPRLRNAEVMPTNQAAQGPRATPARESVRRVTPIPAAEATARLREQLPQLPPTLPAVVEEEEYATTPTPEDGFPEVHHARPESLTEDLALRRVNDLWKHDQDRVVLMHVVNVGYPSPPQKALLTVEITGLLKHHTGETDFVVVSPEPEWAEPPARRKTPRTWAVLGLGPQSTATLIRKRVLSTDWVSVIIYERKLVIPQYLFTLTGFTNNYDDNIRTAVHEAFASDPIYTSIAELAQEHPSLGDMEQDEAVGLILSTLKIRVDTLNNGNLQAAVFCNSPTTSGQKWLEWRKNLMSLPFESQYNPTATARPLELCSCCHSADHVTHLCRFPSTQGWRAPPPETRMFGKPRKQPTRPTVTYTANTTTYPRGRGRGGQMGRGGRYHSGGQVAYDGQAGHYFGM